MAVTPQFYLTGSGDTLSLEYVDDVTRLAGSPHRKVKRRGAKDYPWPHFPMRSSEPAQIYVVSTIHISIAPTWHHAG